MVRRRSLAENEAMEGDRAFFHDCGRREYQEVCMTFKSPPSAAFAGYISSLLMDTRLEDVPVLPRRIAAAAEGFWSEHFNAKSKMGV
jgi:hypothetical protein